MTVSRAANVEGPALLTVTFGKPNPFPTSKSASAIVTDAGATPAESDASTSNAKERTEVINIKNRDEQEILSALIKLTKATPVHATPADKEVLQELEDQRVRSEADSERHKKINAGIAREKDILKAARGELVSE